MKYLLAFVMLLWWGMVSPKACEAGLPDPSLTPGAVNPAVTQANIQQTICTVGWTETIRPSSYYTTKLKKQQMADLHLTGVTGDYEEDHLISLELGGAPKDPHNLWPQPYEGEWGARKKDRIETTLKHLVCAGVVSLTEAQRVIATNWIAAYHQYIPND